MKYKYLKGSEKDFDGAPEWAMVAIKCSGHVIAERQPILEPSWDGVGLPPAGCECEYVFNDSSWGVVKVIGYDGDRVVFKPSGATYYAIAPSNKNIFLPIRSEADKKRDAVTSSILSALVDILADVPWSNEEMSKQMYDAIAAGKIPGVKLED